MENINIGKYSRLDGEKITIEQEWYESLIEFRTKYITLTNFLLGKAELNTIGCLSIYTNVADIMLALEYQKTVAVIEQLQNRKNEEE